MGRKNIKKLLKNVKVEVAHKKGTSTMIVGSPSTRSLNNYMKLLTQLDVNISKTSKV